MAGTFLSAHDKNSPFKIVSNDLWKFLIIHGLHTCNSSLVSLWIVKVRSGNRGTNIGSSLGITSIKSFRISSKMSATCGNSSKYATFASISKQYQWWRVLPTPISDSPPASPQVLQSIKSLSSPFKGHVELWKMNLIDFSFRA